VALATDTAAVRQTWQARCLLAAEGKTGAVLLSILAHNFEERLMFICRAIGFSSYLPAPFLTSAATIEKNGAVVAKMMCRDGRERRRALYASERDLRDDFRRLADRVKLSDTSREQLFLAIKNWVVADRRLDPTMDPKDPDAKRLTIH
jgi:hypothetical protein